MTSNIHLLFEGCYQSFTTEGWLARHRQKQHGGQLGAKPDLGAGGGGPRVYPCLQCGKEFSKPSKLTQHLKTHSPESHYKYPCDICGKKFTRPQHVNRHKLLHTGERPFSCPTCDKTFAREDKLKMHMKSGCSGQDIELGLGHMDEGRESEENLKQASSLTVGVVG